MSFLRDRIGEQMFSEKLDMWDNPLDQRLVGASLFDDEGVPHQRVDLVDNGVVKNLVYDNLTATKDGVESTGNHAKMWGPAGPFARHIIVLEIMQRCGVLLDHLLDISLLARGILLWRK
jgi:predicted Zn-dependent protease